MTKARSGAFLDRIALTDRVRAICEFGNLASAKQMLKRMMRRNQLVARRGSSLYSDKQSNEAPIPAISSRFAASQTLSAHKGAERTKNLNELELENAQLRTSATQLALEIQELRGRRRRSFL